MWLIIEGQEEYVKTESKFRDLITYWECTIE